MDESEELPKTGKMIMMAAKANRPMTIIHHLSAINLPMISQIVNPVSSLVSESESKPELSLSADSVDEVGEGLTEI